MKAFIWVWGVKNGLIIMQLLKMLLVVKVECSLYY